VAADRLGQEPLGGVFIALCCQQEINALACLIHGTIEIIPLAFDLDVRLSMRQLIHTGRLQRWNTSASWGLYFRTHQLIVAWSTDTPRSSMSSSTWR